MSRDQKLLVLHILDYLLYINLSEIEICLRLIILNIKFYIAF